VTDNAIQNEKLHENVLLLGGHRPYSISGFSASSLLKYFAFDCIVKPPICHIITNAYTRGIFGGRESNVVVHDLHNILSGFAFPILPQPHLTFLGFILWSAAAANSD